MKNSKKNTLLIEDLFRAKELFHKERANLPFAEKIRILVQLQEIVTSWGLKKKTQKAWRIPRLS